MSEALKLLRQLYKELNNLYRDCVRLAGTIQDWNEHVIASRTLGNDAPVEAWFLTEQFLLVWSDWSGLLERYQKYFGATEKELPKSWRQLHDRSSELSAELFANRAFAVRLQHWRSSPSEGRSHSDDAKHAARILFHSLIDSHRRAVCMTALSRSNRNWIFQDDSPFVENERHVGAGGQFREFASGMETLHGLRGNIRDDLIVHLQHYRHANLVVSWLFPETLKSPIGSPFALAFMTMPHSVEQILELHDVDDNYRSVVDRVLRRMQEAIGELGYDNFIDDITSKELVGGDESVVGADGVNVIPGHGSGVCNPIVLAVSRGDKRTVGFPIVMKQLREHLIRCIGTTKVVIVLCDHWRTDMLDDHLGDFRAHHDRGVRFVFLLAARPRNSVSPIDIDLR